MWCWISGKNVALVLGIDDEDGQPVFFLVSSGSRDSSLPGAAGG
jgi:hypothetical protein